MFLPYYYYAHILNECLDWNYNSYVCVFAFFFFFFFFSLFLTFQPRYCSLFNPCTVHSKISREVHTSGSVRCLRDPQTSLFNNFFIKNGSHGTIYTFKNYFAIVFLVFNFQFSAVSKQTPKLDIIGSPQI